MRRVCRRLMSLHQVGRLELCVRVVLFRSLCMQHFVLSNNVELVLSYIYEYESIHNTNSISGIIIQVELTISFFLSILILGTPAKKFVSFSARCRTNAGNTKAEARAGAPSAQPMRVVHCGVFSYLSYNSPREGLETAVMPSTCTMRASVGCQRCPILIPIASKFIVPEGAKTKEGARLLSSIRCAYAVGVGRFLFPVAQDWSMVRHLQLSLCLEASTSMSQ